MESYLPENEYKEFESRQYINPQISVDETNTFIDNLRSAQGQQNQEITTDTQMLGTDVPTNLGGLTGAESYFTSRYQTPQTVSDIANLRSVAQAKALNDVLSNEQEMWKKRYQDAYKAYQKRQNAKTNTTGGGSNYEEGEEPTYESTSSTVEIDPLTGQPGSSSVVDPYTGKITDVDIETGESQVRDEGRYVGAQVAGYVPIGYSAQYDGAPGEYIYNSPTGETVRITLPEGYVIRYDTKEKKLVTVKI